MRVGSHGIADHSGSKDRRDVRVPWSSTPDLQRWSTGPLRLAVATVDLLLPPICASCFAPLESAGLGPGLCSSCRREL